MLNEKGSLEPFFYGVNLFVAYSCSYDETYILLSLFEFNYRECFSARSSHVDRFYAQRYFSF